MYELKQVGAHTYYMDCPTIVGFYTSDDRHVILIDSGSDKDAAKKVKKILDAHNWELIMILNTHSHADHIGGNQFLQSQTGCRIYSPGLDCAFTQFPILEPTMLYGGFAPSALHNKFLMAKASPSVPLMPDVLPEGFEVIPLPGHSYDMTGFRTPDDVVFLADCLSSSETLEKYQIGFLYDVASYLDTLERVKGLSAAYFVPSHAPASNAIADLAQINIDKTLQIVSQILDLLSEPISFEDLLAKVFQTYQLTMTLQQRVLVGSTIKSYLAYLVDLGKATYTFSDHYMLWSRVC